MTDLTEQWKKGELPDGHYYVKDGEEINAELEHRLAMVKANGKYPDRISRLKSRVVALSEENSNLKSKLQLKETAYDFDTARLEEENAQLKEDYNRIGKLLRKMEESDNAREKFQSGKIEKLKELLRECLAHLTIGKYGTSVTPINILCDEVEEALK